MNRISIYLVRHGKTIFNTEGKVQGWCDSFLTKEGQRGVHHLKTQLQDKGILLDALYSSDSGRALETSRILMESQPHLSNIKINQDIREYNFGFLEGQPEQEVHRIVPQGMKEAKLWDNPLEVVVNRFHELDKIEQKHEVYQSEDYETYVSRLQKGLQTMVDEAVEEGYKSILAVSHGMSLRILTGSLFPEQTKALDRIYNAAVFELEYINGELQFIKLWNNQELDSK